MSTSETFVEGQLVGTAQLSEWLNTTRDTVRDNLKRLGVKPMYQGGGPRRKIVMYSLSRNEFDTLKSVIEFKQQRRVGAPKKFSLQQPPGAPEKTLPEKALEDRVAEMQQTIDRHTVILEMLAKAWGVEV